MSDYVRSLESLKKFNAFVLQDADLRRLLVLGEYNYLQMFQTPLFEDMQRAVRQAPVTQPTVAKKGSGGVRARQFFSVFLTFLSAAFLILNRRRVLVYTADKNTFPFLGCDFRMTNLFAYLIGRKVGFVEIFHTVFRDDFFSNALKRRRMPLYVESADVVYGLLSGLRLVRVPRVPVSIDWSAAGESEKLFRALVIKYVSAIGRSQFRTRFFKNLLALTGIRILVATSDTRNYNELVAACNKLGIKTHCFQSGNFSKYDVGYLDCSGMQGRIIKPYQMLVENGYWKKELLRLGTYFKDKEIEIGGNLKEDYRELPAQSSKHIAEEVTVLIPYEIAAPKEEVLAYIKKLLAVAGVRVVFKFRADRNLKEQVEEYGLDGLGGNLCLVTTMDEVGDFDIAAGTYSTFLYEMIGQLKPVIFFKTTLDYGEGLVANGLAQEVSINDDMARAIEEAAGTSTEALLERRATLYGDTRPLPEALDAILS